MATAIPMSTLKDRPTVQAVSHLLAGDEIFQTTPLPFVLIDHCNQGVFNAMSGYSRSLQDPAKPLYERAIPATAFLQPNVLVLLMSSLAGMTRSFGDPKK